MYDYVSLINCVYNVDTIYFVIKKKRITFEEEFI